MQDLKKIFKNTVGIISNMKLYPTD